MPAFRTSGSTGQAPNTVWMSTLADKFTMQANGKSGFCGGNISFISFSPPSSPIISCNFANQFLPFQATLGAFTTAPDGTTNVAQKIVEDTTATSVHLIEAGMPGTPAITNMRTAGIFKTLGGSDRTRIAFYISETNAQLGVMVGFDLAGGQIAYGPQLKNFAGPGSNNPYVGLAASMVSLGSGWWLCIFDWTITGPFSNGGFNGGVVFPRVLLDAGSGTAAANVSYTGNGTSGVYGWRCSTLPVAAWGINTTVFFDDFNDPTLANVDKSGTYADGFDWYLTGFIPGYLASQPLPAANLVQSGSSLTMLPVAISAPYTFTPALGSWGNPGDGRAHGAKGRNIFVPPVLFETKSKIPWLQYPNHMGNNVEMSVSFFQSVEWCDNLSNAAVVTGSPPFVQADGAKMDHTQGGWAPTWMDFNFPTNGPNGFATTQFGTSYNKIKFTLLTDPGMPPGFGSSLALQGINDYPQWQTGFVAAGGYNFGHVVYHIPDATFYEGVRNNNTVEPPGTPAVDWNVYSYPPGTASNLRPAIFNDLTQFQVYTLMILPYDRVNRAPGVIIGWTNGVYTGLGAIWDPNAGGKSIPFGNTIPHTTDWHHIFWQMQTGYHAGTGYGFTHDYVKVMQ